MVDLKDISSKSLLDESNKTYNIDTSRIYLTGLSMVGYATFALSQVYPEYFAAVAPICGGGTPSMVNFYSNHLHRFFMEMEMKLYLLKVRK